MRGMSWDKVRKLLAEASSGALVGTYGYIFIPAAVMVPDDTDGAEAGTNDLTNIHRDFYAFDGGTDESTFVTVPVPLDMDTSVNPTAMFDWGGASGCSASDTVEWAIAMVAKSDNDTLDAAMGTAQEVNDALHEDFATSDEQWTAFTDGIVIAGSPAVGDMLDIQVMRDVSEDSMAEDGLLYYTVIQYTRTNQPSA